MKRLILMRHAKSDWSGHVSSDHDRPLNKRGRHSADALGAWLREIDIQPDTVLCSSAERTHETLALLKVAEDAAVDFTRALYLASAGEILAQLHRAEGETVLMLGHNPGISAFAQMILSAPPEGEDFLRYPTGATVIAEFDVESWADVAWYSGTLRHFMIPRRLPGMA